MDNNSIDSLINQMVSYEGRMLATVRAHELGYQVNPNSLREAIVYLRDLEKKQIKRREDKFLLDMFGLLDFDGADLRMVEYELKLAKKAEREGRPRSLKYRIKKAIFWLNQAEKYAESYQLAIKFNLVDHADWAFKRQMEYLEKKGKFLACAAWEDQRGNAQRTQMYEDLSNSLKMA